MSIALYIGRFQPLHLGHLEYIKKILSENDRIIIVIGSSQEKKTSKNPFTVKERKEMLKVCLREEKIPSDKVRIISARDYPGENKKWLESIKRKAGKFDVFYAGENRLTARIFRENYFNIRTIQRINDISSTNVRELMREGKDWRRLVPESVYDYLMHLV